jgi:hypothetical protein
VTIVRPRSSSGRSAVRSRYSIPDLGQVSGLVELELKNNELSGPLPQPPARLGSASLCPNGLTHPSADAAIDRRWNQATKSTPWWRDCR